MTVRQVLILANKLLNKKITSAYIDSEVILSFVINKPKEFLFTHPDFKLTSRQIKKFKKLITRRNKSEPVAYLTRQKEFFGLNFIVNKNVLIPRPETELLVEEALKIIKNSRNKTTLIDVGTGSGCIPIAISKNVPEKKLQVLATDISTSALKIARQNSRRHKVKINFLRSNLLQKILQNNLLDTDKILIIANLPYLTATQMKEKTIQHEPRAALYGGKDGLQYYKKLLEQIKMLYTPPSAPPSANWRSGRRNGLDTLLEIDPSQSRKIISLTKKILPQAKAELKKDLAGKNRLVIITL